MMNLIEQFNPMKFGHFDGQQDETHMQSYEQGQKMAHDHYNKALSDGKVYFERSLYGNIAALNGMFTVYRETCGTYVYHGPNWHEAVSAQKECNPANRV